MTTQQPQEKTQRISAAGNVAIYKRSAVQEKRIIRQKPIQQHDLIHLAHTLGFDDSRIFLFEQDNCTPGNTDIGKRVGLASIMQEIANGTIRAILVAHETRLFREPVETYDFSNPLHIKLFRFNCLKAFEVLQEAYKITRRARSKHNGS